MGLVKEFIRIRSPSKEPPVLRFDGSTQTIPNFLSGYAFKKRCEISSIKDDFPAPPVPVIPKTNGFLFFAEKELKPTESKDSILWPFSIAVNAIPISTDGIKSLLKTFFLVAIFFWASSKLKSQPSTIIRIMPSRPSLRPSSG